MASSRKLDGTTPPPLPHNFLINFEKIRSLYDEKYADIDEGVDPENRKTFVRFLFMIVQTEGEVAQLERARAYEEDIHFTKAKLAMYERNADGHAEALRKRFLLGDAGDGAEYYGDGDQSATFSVPGVQLSLQAIRGADYHPYNNSMMSEWSRACFAADLDKMKSCLEQDPTLLDRRESILRLNGLLHVAAGACGRISYVSEPDDTALEPTSPTQDYVKAICYLVEKGADLQSRNIAGHTALHMLTHEEVSVLSLQLAEVLIVLGADVNARCRMGRSPIFEAVSNRDKEAIGFLLRHGAKVSIANTSGDVISCFAIEEMPEMEVTFMKASDRERLKIIGVDPPKCHYCMEDDYIFDDDESDLKLCGNCGCRAYCSRDCQKKDWKIHKFACALIIDRKDRAW